MLGPYIFVYNNNIYYLQYDFFYNDNRSFLSFHCVIGTCAIQTLMLQNAAENAVLTGDCSFRQLSAWVYYNKS